MSTFDTAPLDPIFWLHHANIDRLWTTWLGDENHSHTNPADGGWLDHAFDFHNELGGPVTLTPRDVLDTDADLGYHYDRLGPATAVREELTIVAPDNPPDHPAELVGATDSAITLAGETTAAAFPVSAPTGPAAASLTAAGDPAPSREFLNVEGVQVEQNPGISYFAGSSRELRGSRREPEGVHRLRGDSTLGFVVNPGGGDARRRCAGAGGRRGCIGRRWSRRGRTRRPGAAGRARG